ncbi:MAG TPA: hypothetical protein VNR61_04715 [Niallia sp.]|nr:hypothetical protein [Niallia sp.]
MKKTNIQVNMSTKTVNISVAGKMTLEDAKLFVSEYNRKMSQINGADYVLEVDCKEMQVLTPEMTEDLTGVMKMYKSTGFKEVIFQIKSNTILKMQLSRIVRNAALSQGTVVEVAQ